jgi:hypothetical protein
MKKLVSLSIWASVLLAVQLLNNCSRPLESIPDEGSAPPETVVVVDTVTYADTIIVVVPDSGGSQLLCGRLSSHRQQIVWMFPGWDGLFLLEFQALPERGHPRQTLAVDIEDQQYLWLLAESTEFTKEQRLDGNTVVRISTVPPYAFGHPIDICLSIREP